MKCQGEESTWLISCSGRQHINSLRCSVVLGRYSAVVRKCQEHGWLGKNWLFGLRCFFGAAGCDATSGTRGTMFILMYVLSYVGGANLLRHAEGATWLAIVTSLVTPLGFFFWSLFIEPPFSGSHIT
ncbi:hypothetical protein OS493_028205 [Desmophyllum pertusum]|uniref:Uncharacterized protein n=1 Tax=Desmophyllum pertusum TaxID=174260 RepID=A0A9W9YWX4_9CNID|nr:hypothetical protein OS493_028205 [Desmophyllum pertusum]